MLFISSLVWLKFQWYLWSGILVLLVVYLGNTNESLVGYFWKYASCKHNSLKHHAVSRWTGQGVLFIHNLLFSGFQVKILVFLQLFETNIPISSLQENQNWFTFLANQLAPADQSCTAQLTRCNSIGWQWIICCIALSTTFEQLGPGDFYSKVLKFCRSISGTTIIAFISLQCRGSKPSNLAILLVFLTLKKC